MKVQCELKDSLKLVVAPGSYNEKLIKLDANKNKTIIRQ